MLAHLSTILWHIIDVYVCITDCTTSLAKLSSGLYSNRDAATQRFLSQAPSRFLETDIVLDVCVCMCVHPEAGNN